MNFLLRHAVQTVPYVIRDFPDWHRGRREYTVWVVELAQDDILAKVEAARKHLSGLLLNSYRRQPHITLFVCGFFTDSPRFDDDFCQSQLDAHLQLLSEAKVDPFSIEIGGLNSFVSAPFLEVHDKEGGIERVRGLLSTLGREVDRDTFTPHVTVGLYSEAFSTKAVIEKLSAFPGDPVNCAVERISFAAYSASEICGPLVYKRYAVLRR
jgi:2'-5' RNA ligase